MDLKPVSIEREAHPNLSQSHAKIRPNASPSKQEGRMGEPPVENEYSGKSFRVDESSTRITISLIHRETGKIIQQLSPTEAVRYVRHLNEAIRNMLNELA